MQRKAKSQVTTRAAICLFGQTCAYLHLGSTVWINGQFLETTQSIIPGTALLCSLSIGLLVSKKILRVSGSYTRQIYLISGVLAAISFYLFTMASQIWQFTLLSISMGLFSGVAYYAPVLSAQLHLPDRPELVAAIVLAATSVGFSLCCLMPVNVIALFYFVCVFVATICLIEPAGGLYIKPNDLERLRHLMLENTCDVNDSHVWRSHQLVNITTVSAFTMVLPVCCLLGFQRLLPDDTFFSNGMASIWMLINLVARIMSKQIAQLGGKRTILLFMIGLQYLGLVLFRYNSLGVYSCFFISAATSGFVQTLMPIMMVQIYREQSWLYERVVYPFSLIIASALAALLLQWDTETIYLWCMLTTSFGFAVLTVGNYSRYQTPIVVRKQPNTPTTVLDN